MWRARWILSLPRTLQLFVPRPLILRSRTDIENEVRQRVEAERQRLLELTAQECQSVRHFHRPVERPFTAAERDHVTILFGGLTWKHEWLIKAVFQSARLSSAR